MTVQAGLTRPAYRPRSGRGPATTAGRAGSSDEREVATIEGDLRSAVTDDLVDWLAARREACATISEEFAAAADDLTRFVVGGGKRLRPTFAWWGWRGAGGTGDPAGVLRAVSSLELVQACALVHDDLIDDSATRRGEPTVHARWGVRHADASWSGSPARFGAAVAILLGDVALVWADDMLHESGVDPETLTRVRPVWAAMRTEVLGGQYLDVRGHAASDHSPEAALRISRYKTAAYTVERPLHLGAALADADPAIVAAYRGYGTELGIAFQLRDDVLGVFGDPEVTGKPAGDDLREGKLTMLTALAHRHGHTPAGAAVTRAVGDPDLDADGVAAAREALVDLGILDEVERRIDTLTSSALAHLDDVDLIDPVGERLAELAVAATRRVS